MQAIADRLYPRYLAAWPEAKLLSSPFVYDPRARILITSFPRRARGPSQQERQCLATVQARITELSRTGKLPKMPFWIWPNREDVTPSSADPGWLNRWSRDRVAIQLPG
jgi:hypothetical protein